MASQNDDASAFRREVFVRRAAREKASAAGVASSSSAASSSGDGSKKLTAIPAHLDIESMNAFLPSGAKIHVAYEPQSGSLRAWYFMSDGSEKSSNASMDLYGIAAFVVVLQEVWQLHEALTGIACPYALP